MIDFSLLNSNMFSVLLRTDVTNANTRFTGIAWNSSSIENCPLNHGMLYSIGCGVTGFQLFIGYKNSGFFYRDTTNTMDNDWIQIK